MHYLHCILVKLEEDRTGTMDDEELEQYAREIAMSETEEFEGKAFDWRTEEGAGRWSSIFPDRAVILGKNKQKFAEELDKFKQYPKKAALDKLEMIKYGKTAWRKKEEIDEEEDIIILENKNNGQIGREGQPIFWSGTIREPIKIDENFIELMQQSNDYKKDWMLPYSIKSMISLAGGEYTSDSQFFSLPNYSTIVSEETYEEIKNKPELFALVFSDYHY